MAKNINNIRSYADCTPHICENISCPFYADGDYVVAIECPYMTKKCCKKCGRRDLPITEFIRIRTRRDKTPSGKQLPKVFASCNICHLRQRNTRNKI